jgi:hypothetical protein
MDCRFESPVLSEERKDLQDSQARISKGQRGDLVFMRVYPKDSERSSRLKRNQTSCLCDFEHLKNTIEHADAGPATIDNPYKPGDISKKRVRAFAKGSTDTKKMLSDVADKNPNIDQLKEELLLWWSEGDEGRNRWRETISWQSDSRARSIALSGLLAKGIFVRPSPLSGDASSDETYDVWHLVHNKFKGYVPDGVTINSYYGEEAALNGADGDRSCFFEHTHIPRPRDREFTKGDVQTEAGPTRPCFDVRR